METEIWKVVEDYPRYEVSNLGRVRSWAKWGGKRGERAEEPHMRKASLHKGTNATAYFKLTMYNERGRNVLFVHTLVLEAFQGKRPAGMVCRHLDGNSLNNRADNLAWGTPAQNTADRYLHGTANIVAGKIAPVLSDQEAYEVRTRALNGERPTDIAKDYPQAGYELVRQIARGEARAKAVKAYADSLGDETPADDTVLEAA